MQSIANKNYHKKSVTKQTLCIAKKILENKLELLQNK